MLLNGKVEEGYEEMKNYLVNANLSQFKGWRYGMIAINMGKLAIEYKRYDEAKKWLDAGG